MSARSLSRATRQRRAKLRSTSGRVPRGARVGRERGVALLRAAVPAVRTNATLGFDGCLFRGDAPAPRARPSRSDLPDRPGERHAADDEGVGWLSLVLMPA